MAIQQVEMSISKGLSKKLPLILSKTNKFKET
jgi:hypothetical protein